jgi:gluconolactonase
VSTLAGAVFALLAQAHATAGSLSSASRPAAVVDLRTNEGAALVRGQWRWSDAQIVEVDHRGPGPDLKPSAAPLRTHDLVPRAGAADFDDSKWQPIAADTLEQRRSTGKLCFCWYRVRVTIPEKVAGFSTAGSTVVFEIVVDDYAEVWVDGRQPVVLGQTGGPLAAGFNAPNRVVLTRDARPGEEHVIAVFGANAPLSNLPGNFIWVRSCTLDFYRAADARAGVEVHLTVARKDPGLDEILPAGARLEKLADRFLFIEGPVWHPDGYLLFSDPNANVIWRFSEDFGLSIFRTKSGYGGADIGLYGQLGSNGLALDPGGLLSICEHGNRRVTRLERNGQITVLADRFEGKRLNSPNDLVYRSDGALFFTDPPFGLPKLHDDPRRELPHTGVYCLKDGALRLVSTDLSGPNGLAFSPDEKLLYVDNWDERRKVVMRYECREDGTLANGSVLFDMKEAPESEALDGLKVDRRGNLYVSGPGGIWILSSDGRHLGTIRGPEPAHNFAWGEADGRMLYLAARTGLYRVRLLVPGVRAAPVTRS